MDEELTTPEVENPPAETTEEVSARIYPYPKDENEHPYAFVFFHAAGAGLDFDGCNAMARHVFDDLGCAPPGSAHPPKIHHDALGTDGGPWKEGAWQDVEKPRIVVVATAPKKDVTAMTPEERAERRAALDAAEVAEQALTNRHSDKTGEG